MSRPPAAAVWAGGVMTLTPNGQRGNVIWNRSDSTVTRLRVGHSRIPFSIPGRVIVPFCTTSPQTLEPIHRLLPPDVEIRNTCRYVVNPGCVFTVSIRRQIYISTGVK